jgi:hypothetical protein
MLKNNVEVNKKLTISVRTHVTFEQIKSLLDSASRGSSYWSRQDLGYESEAELALSLEGIEIEDMEESEERFVGGFWEKNAPKIHVLNLPKIKRGLTVMAKKEPIEFANFIKGDYDMNTGDAFLQCCLFGEVIYS